MQDFFRNKFASDSESDDDDYIPEEVMDKQTKKAIEKQTKLSQQRKEKVQQIWKEMNEQDSARSSKKVDEELSLDAIKSLVKRVKDQQPQPQKIRFAGQTYDLSADNEYKILEPCDEEKKNKE